MMEHGLPIPYITGSRVGEVPVGGVIAYFGDINRPEGNDSQPSPLEALGWMVCDGRSLKIQHYPHLYAVLGTRYGGQDDQFCLPDLRNAVLPGAGAAATNAQAMSISYIIRITILFRS